MKHVYCIFLEWENGRIIKHTKQCNEPETTTGENLSEVADFEWIILFFSFTSLCIEFLIHEEINDKHDECDGKENHTKSNRTRNTDNATQFCEIR